jgi:hypothetical protein
MSQMMRRQRRTRLGKRKRGRISVGKETSGEREVLGTMNS